MGLAAFAAFMKQDVIDNNTAVVVNDSDLGGQSEAFSTDSSLAGL